MKFQSRPTKLGYSNFNHHSLSSLSYAKIRSTMAMPPKELEGIISPQFVQKLKQNTLLNTYTSLAARKLPNRKILSKTTRKLSAEIQSRKVVQQSRKYSDDINLRKQEKSKFLLDKSDEKKKTLQNLTYCDGHQETARVEKMKKVSPRYLSTSQTDAQLPPLTKDKHITPNKQLIKLVSMDDHHNSCSKPLSPIHSKPPLKKIRPLLRISHSMIITMQDEKDNFQNNINNEIPKNVKKASINTFENTEESGEKSKNMEINHSPSHSVDMDSPIDARARSINDLLFPSLPSKQNVEVPLKRMTTIGIFGRGNNSYKDMRHRIECQKAIGHAEQMKNLERVKELSEEGFISKESNNRNFLEILKEDEEEENKATVITPFKDDENEDLVGIIGRKKDFQSEKGRKLVAHLQRQGTIKAKNKARNRAKHNFKDIHVAI